MLRYFRFVDINIQTKSRQCRGKEEESGAACCMETPEQLRPVRRVLVVCSPSLAVAMAWNGEQFFVRTCCALRLQPHPQENADSGMFRGGKRRLGGTSLCSLPDCDYSIPDNRGKSLWTF